MTSAEVLAAEPLGAAAAADREDEAIIGFEEEGFWGISNFYCEILKRIQIGLEKKKEKKSNM